jgi:hypothetical protein
MKPWINLEYLYNKILELLSAIPKLLAKIFGLIEFEGVRTLLLIISLILAAGIIYVTTRIIQLQKKKFKDIIDFMPQEAPPEERGNQWESIKKHIENDDEAQWRLAILEADTILDDILKRIGVKGTNLGERLKNTETSDFENLQNAWEAHKVRNRIAHEGAKFDLSKGEAKRVIELYEKCLKEFRFI